MFTELRPYQQDIVDKTLNTTKSTLIQIPTGGGKTLISKEIAIKLINDFGKQVLFVAPKIVLMQQTAEVFKNLKPHILHGTSKFDKNHHTLISTIQTASRRDINPDVIIIDEIHYGYDGVMIEKLIKDKPNLRIIGLSATPYDINGYLLKGFDVVLNQYDMKYMIQNGYLVPIRSFVLVSPDLSNVKILAGDYETNELSKAMSKNKIILEIVKTSKPFIENSNKVIVFAVDINHAELLKIAFCEEGFVAAALHSNLSKEQVDLEIDRFKKGYTKILVSVLMLTTGFDVPETDVAIIARPTKSQNLYKQMVGRIARLSKDKKYGVLLDCGNVIQNLGKPLDPIIEKDELDKKTQKLLCKKCDSEHIKLKKAKDHLYWECQDCGDIKELEKKNQYKCENCKKEYGFEGDFELVNNKLYLNCACGYETLISEFKGNEKFIEVESDSNIEEEFKKFIVTYIFFIKKYFGVNALLNKKVRTIILELKDEYYSNPSIYTDEEIKRKVFQDNQKLFEKKRNNSQNIEFLSFEEAKKYIKKLNIYSRKIWNDFKKSDEFPSFLPKKPEIEYKNKGWVDFNNWVGKKDINEYLSFEEARSFARSLKLTSKRKWELYCNGELTKYEKKPNNIPTNPYIYNNYGFLDFNDWLGAKKEYSIEQICLETNLTYDAVILRAKANTFILNDKSIISIPLAKRIIELIK